MAPKVAAGWRLTRQYRPGTLANSVNWLTIKGLRATNVTLDEGLRGAQLSQSQTYALIRRGASSHQDRRTRGLESRAGRSGELHQRGVRERRRWVQAHPFTNEIELNSRPTLADRQANEPHGR